MVMLAEVEVELESTDAAEEQTWPWPAVLCVWVGAWLIGALIEIGFFVGFLALGRLLVRVLA